MLQIFYKGKMDPFFCKLRVLLCSLHWTWTQPFFASTSQVGVHATATGLEIDLSNIIDVDQNPSLWFSKDNYFRASNDHKAIPVLTCYFSEDIFVVKMFYSLALEVFSEL